MKAGQKKNIAEDFPQWSGVIRWAKQGGIYGQMFNYRLCVCAKRLDEATSELFIEQDHANLYMLLWLTHLQPVSREFMTGLMIRNHFQIILDPDWSEGVD